MLLSEVEKMQKQRRNLRTAWRSLPLWKARPLPMVLRATYSRQSLGFAVVFVRKLLCAELD